MVATAADHAAEAALLSQLPAQHLDLAQRVLALADLVEQDLQALRLDRLREVVVGAFLNRLDSRLHAALRRQQHHRAFGAIVLESLEQFEAAHARHDEVGDDDRRTERRHALERIFPVGGGFGGESPGAHEFGQADSRAGLVFDDQDSLNGWVRHSARRWAMVLCRFYTIQHSR